MGFVGVEVEPSSFYRIVRRVEIEGLPVQPLSLLNICARVVALEIEHDPFAPEPHQVNNAQ